MHVGKKFYGNGQSNVWERQRGATGWFIRMQKDRKEQHHGAFEENIAWTDNGEKRMRVNGRL